MTPGVRLQRLALITAAIALATVVFGWKGVALAAALFAGLDWRRSSAAWEAALGAGIAWATLLLVMTGSAVLRATESLGGAMGIPGFALVVITMLFPAMLAWSSAEVTQLVVRLARR